MGVMTFNIRFGTADDGPNHWRHRYQRVFGVVRKYAPDILCVQEALRFQLDELRAEFPNYDEFGVGRDDGRQTGEFAAVLFDRQRVQRLDGGTFWFSDTPEVICSTSWGNTICRICTWARFRDLASGKAFYVFNVHFDHASAPSRLRSAKLLIERIRARTSSDPVIVTGDFNTGEGSPPIEALIDADIAAGRHAGGGGRLRDTFRLVHPEATAAGTFGGWVGRTDGSKIDYVFVVEGVFEVLDADIAHDVEEGAYPSDHFPVWAKLRIR